MYRLLSSMSFTTYTIFIILTIILLIYSFFDLRKKKPEHPYKYLALFSIPTMVVAIFYKYVHEFEVSSFWVDFVETIWIILVIFMFALLGYSTYLADKKGFISPKGKVLLKSTLIPCLIVLVLCALGIILINKFWA